MSQSTLSSRKGAAAIAAPSLFSLTAPPTPTCELRIVHELRIGHAHVDTVVDPHDVEQSCAVRNRSVDLEAQSLNPR